MAKVKKAKDLKLTDFSKLVTQIADYKGVMRLDIRRYIDTNMSLTDHKWIPTKAGISIPIDSWPDFVVYMKRVINKVKEELEK